MAAGETQFHGDTSQAEQQIERITERIESTESVEGVLLSTRPRRTGVVIGTHLEVTQERASAMKAELERIFPAVTFAIVSGASNSIAFEWDEPEPEGDVLW